MGLQQVSAQPLSLVLPGIAPVVQGPHVTGLGTVEDAKITTSSGSSRLDSQALSTVAGVKFPPPPYGLSAAQLTYVIPYRFQ
jgi:TonB family protein